MSGDLDQIRGELAAIAELDVEVPGHLRRYTDTWANVGRHVPALVDEIEQLRERVLARDYWARGVVFHHELSEDHRAGDDWYATIAKHLKSALAESSELRALFDLQHTRMVEATRRWREESPEERALISPDLGELLAWLLDRADADLVVVEQLRGERDDNRTEIAELQERLARADTNRWQRPATDGLPDGPAWRPITCAEADHIRISRGLAPSGGYTDLNGSLCGEPAILTEWAPSDNDTEPVLRNYRYPQPGGGRPDRRPCTHFTTIDPDGSDT